MWRSVAIDFSVDFRLVKPVNVHERELVVKMEKKNTNLPAEAQRYRALSMTTISNRVWHCRLVFPCSSKWRELVSRQSFLFFSDINSYRYNQVQLSMCRNIVLEWSCMILSGFRKVLIGNTIVTCLQSSYRANEMHICKLMFISCFHTTGNST